MRRYKGYTITNVSDPAFPMYGIFTPNGERVGTTLFPSDFKEIVNKHINQQNS